MLSVNPATNTPFGLAVDPVNGKVYWTEFSVSFKGICRMSVNGGAVETLISSGATRPRGIALDVANSRMYWTDDLRPNEMEQLTIRQVPRTVGEILRLFWQILVPSKERPATKRFIRQYSIWCRETLVRAGLAEDDGRAHGATPGALYSMRATPFFKAWARPGKTS